MVRPSSLGRVCGYFALLLLLQVIFPFSAFAADQQPIQTPEQTGNPMVFGIAAHAWWLDPEVYGDQLFAALDDLRVTTVRTPIDWKRFEPVEGQYDWSLYDRVFGELARRNIVIVADFNTIPGWASVDQAGCDDEATEIWVCELRADKVDAFKRAVRAVVSRYAWIEHWEFWNEPEMWQLLGEDATVYLRNLRIFYDIAHEVNPEIEVAAQTLVGPEYMEYMYNICASWYGAGNEPWDAISIHPYNWNYTPESSNPPMELAYDRIVNLRNLMIARGDGNQPIWITEYGWNNGAENMAKNLVAALDWMKRQPYIEFAHLHMLHDWNTVPVDFFGLMSIVPDANGFQYLGPDTQFTPKQPFYDAFKNYPRDGWPAKPWDAGSVYFPQTRQSLSGRFLKAWQARGGLEIMGYPLSRPYPRQDDNGNWLLVQDFERARLEYHPEFVGTDNEVLGTLIGAEITANRRAEPAFQPLGICPSSPERDCFAATGHSLAYGFRAYWKAHGGLTVFGYPISEEFVEVDPISGIAYTVQYFERARFEYHPELAGTPYEVLLGLLIRQDLEAEGVLPPPPDIRTPTQPSYQ